MKRKFLTLVAAVSAVYLLVAGPLPDPIPLLDEGVMVWLLVWSMKHLGHDVSRWLPFLGRGKSVGGRRPGASPTGKASEATLDV